LSLCQVSEKRSLDISLVPILDHVLDEHFGDGLEANLSYCPFAVSEPRCGNAGESARAPDADVLLIEHCTGRSEVSVWRLLRWLRIGHSKSDRWSQRLDTQPA
jgi:hypothetical protein